MASILLMAYKNLLVDEWNKRDDEGWYTCCSAICVLIITAVMIPNTHIAMVNKCGVHCGE